MIPEMSKRWYGDMVAIPDHPVDGVNLLGVQKQQPRVLFDFYFVKSAHRLFQGFTDVGEFPDELVIDPLDDQIVQIFITDGKRRGDDIRDNDDFLAPVALVCVEILLVFCW